VKGPQSPPIVVEPGGGWQVAIAPARVAMPVFGPVTLAPEPCPTCLVYGSRTGRQFASAPPSSAAPPSIAAITSMAARYASQPIRHTATARPMLV